jgi:hypothetical protein
VTGERTLFTVSGYLDDLDASTAALVEQYGYETVLASVTRWAPARKVPSAPARVTDPETSHLAAKREPDVGRFSERSRSAKLLRAFSTQPLTDQQATVRVVGASAVPSAFDGCRRRCSDLRAAGYLADSGRRRKNPGSDDESIVWMITVPGRQAVANLDHYGWSR